MRVSYSALSSFNQCPLKYKWQFLDRVKVPSTPDQFFGGLIHSVLEFALKNGELLPLEKLLEYYKNNWKSEIFNNKKCEAPYRSAGSDNGEKESYSAGLEMIKNFYSSYKPTEIQVLNTEKFFEIYWQDHKIVGKIDRIDRLPTGEIEIIDYKTNKKLPNENDFKYDWQLPLYAWAAQTLFSNQPPLDPSGARGRQVTSDQDIPSIKLTFHYLRHNKKIAPPNTKTLEELQRYILDTIYKIQNSKFEAQTSNLCGWCEYLHLCPAGQNFINQKSKINPSRQKGEAKAENQNLNPKSDSCDSCKKISGDNNNIISHQQSLF